jgi:hypothetical protein
VEDEKVRLGPSLLSHIFSIIARGGGDDMNRTSTLLFRFFAKKLGKETCEK